MAYFQTGINLTHKTRFPNVFFLVIALLLAANSSPIKAEEPELLSHSQVLMLISDYRQDPLSPEGFKTAAQIVNFAEKSSAVVVELNPKNTHW